MMRDIILRLCQLIEEETKRDTRTKDFCIRALIGVSQGHLQWKNHSYFVNSRIKFTYPPCSFQPNPTGNYEVTHTTIGEKCLFSMDSNNELSVFLNRVFGEGIFRWTVHIEYPFIDSPNDSVLFGLGSIAADLIWRYNNAVFDDFYDSDSGCSFTFGWELDAPVSWLVGIQGFRCFDVETAVPRCSTFAVDVDVDARTLVFFVNGKKLLHAISDIRTPLCIGTSFLHVHNSPPTCNRAVLTSISLRRIPTASATREGDIQFHRSR